MNTQQQQDLARILAVDEVQKKLKQPETLKAMSIKECLDFARSYEISFPVACDLLRTLSAENAALRAALGILVTEALAVANDHPRPRYTRLDEALESAKHFIKGNVAPAQGMAGEVK